MPTFPEGLFELLDSHTLTREHVVIMHRDDFYSLRTLVLREDPIFAVRPTIQGARIISDSSHPRGFVTILDGRARPDLLLNYSEVVDALKSPKPACPLHEPRSLWERLDEDE